MLASDRVIGKNVDSSADRSNQAGRVDGYPTSAGHVPVLQTFGADGGL